MAKWATKLLGLGLYKSQYDDSYVHSNPEIRVVFCRGRRSSGHSGIYMDRETLYFHYNSGRYSRFIKADDQGFAKVEKLVSGKLGKKV